MPPKKTEALAAAFFDAIENGDIQALADCYDDHVVIWHNTDRLETGKAQNIALLERFMAIAPVRRYEKRRLSILPGGFVQQHVVEAVLTSGRRCALHACVVCAVADGRITRLDEYFDSAEVAAFAG